MALYHQARPALPVTDPREALENRRKVCEARGYCGPFVNREYYDSFPDPIWHGTGECSVCCNTCSVEIELAKERAAQDSGEVGAKAVGEETGGSGGRVATRG